MLLQRFYRPHDYFDWLSRDLSARLPNTYAGLFRHFFRLMPVAFITLSLLSIVNQSIAVGMTYALKYLLDGLDAAPVKTLAVAQLAAVPLVVLLLARTLVQWLTWIASYRTTRPLELRMRMEILHYVQTREAAYFDSMLSGKLLQKSGDMAGQIDRLMNTWLWNLGPAIVYFLTAFVLLARVQLWLAIGLGGLFAIFLLIAYRVGRQAIATYSGPMNEARAQLTGRYADSLTNHRSMILFDTAEQESRSLARIADRVLNINQQSYLGTVSVRFCSQAMTLLTWFGLIGSGLYGWTQGQVSIGDLAMLSTLAILFLNRAVELAESLPDLVDSFATLRDNIETVIRPETLADAPNAQLLRLNRGAITITGISFGYTPDTLVFDQFSLDLRASERVGLVGPSGAGKTSLTSLLLRLYDVQAGAITIDGQDLCAVTQSSLRRQVAYVPQDLVLFYRSLTENIAYGADVIDQVQVEAAARAAYAHDFIMELPDGYASLVGERGIRLSGGQRQRIALARAFYKDAPLVILDEPTSALDSESEHAVQQALETLLQGRTALVIAHRLSTIAHLDRIVVLDHGRIAEDGTHAQLLAQNGLYARMWRLQTEGFLGAAKA